MCGICNHMLGTRYGSRKERGNVQRRGIGQWGRGTVCRHFQQAVEAGYQAASQPVSQTLNGAFIELINCDSSFNLCVCCGCVCAVCAVLYGVVLFALPAPMPMRARAMCCGVRCWKPFARILKLKLPDLLLMMYDFRERRSLKIKTTFTAHGARCSLCMYLCVCMSIYVYILWVLVTRVFGQNKEPVAHY